MSSASKRTDKGKKRATSAELDNDRLLEKLEADQAKLEAEKALIAQRIAELKAARAYVDGGNDDDADNGGDEDDGEDEREERREEGMSAGTGRSGTGRPGTGEKRRAPERSESPAVKRSRKENPWEATPFVRCDECRKHSASCTAQPGKALAGYACGRCHFKKVRCSFRDPETGPRSRPNKRKDPKTSRSAGSEADLADLVRTPIQAYFHGGVIDDLLMRVGTMEMKIAQLELGQRAAGLQQIKAEPEPEPGLIPVLVQVSRRDRDREPGPSRIVEEDVEMGEPEGEPEPETTPEVEQPENESRVEGPVGGEERPVSVGVPAIVPEEIEEQRDVPVDAPVEPQTTAPVDVPEPEATAGPAVEPEVKQEPEEGRVPRKEPVKIMVDIRREVVKGKEVEVIELMDSDEE
ncbi:hypothetical protein GGX14DRAFT_555424 [Mycena pura]|uniref:Zn(2)-C6 fungal-type domain-containing protein n=1 Tax=Mycena pura TaxID=153505 RepID=A0AAD6YQZ2_9AGAR|nr:hypothetical protein GGX14DRAFT_555424 [Mycena pura]